MAKEKRKAPSKKQARAQNKGGAAEKSEGKWQDFLHRHSRVKMSETSGGKQNDGKSKKNDE